METKQAGTPAHYGQSMVRPGDRTSLISPPPAPSQRAGTPAHPDGGVHRTDPLSLPLEKRGGEKNSLICTKNCSNYPIYFAIPYKMTTFAKNFLIILR